MTLNDFDLPTILTRVIAAVVILIVTALLARLVKTVLTRQLTKVEVLRRQDASGHRLGESLSSVASLVVWLLGLVAILNLFALTEVVAPLRDLVDGVLAVLPGVIGAALILALGLLLARVVRQLVETALSAAGADRWLTRVGRRRDEHAGTTTDGSATGTTSSATASTASTASTAPAVSELAGRLVQGLIIVVVAISALQVLGIETIAEPATRMLSLILNTVPAVLAAALLLGIGYLVSGFVAPLLESTLRGLGVDRSLSDLGLGGARTSPSAVLARVAQVAIVLFFAIAATRVLGFPEVTAILDSVLEVAGAIVLGVAVIAVGVLLANLAPRFVDGQAGQVLRVAVVVLFVAIGLRSTGLADSVVNLAFGALVVGAATAAALAFGLGGRDAAARQLDRLERRSEARATTGATTTQDGPGAPGGTGRDPLGP